MMARGALRYVVVVLLAGLLARPALSASGEGGEPRPDASAIVARAAAAASRGETDRAVDLYASVARLFPDSPAAADSLWRAAGLARSLARDHGGDWERARSLYRDFVVAAPGDRRVADAYLEIARINLRLRLYPEARSYLRLVMKKFPAAPAADTARYLLARVEMKLGRVESAAAVVRVLSRSRDPVMRNRAALLMADILVSRGRLGRAISLARRTGKKFPPGSPGYVEAFRITGRARLLMSDPRARARGREDLFYYLNVTPERDEVEGIRLLLADSLFREKEYRAAQRLFEMLARTAVPDSRAWTMARFRLAMIRDLGLVSRPPPADSPVWGEDGDRIYHQAIRRLPGRRVSQDARYLLVRRMLARGDEEGAYARARDYLDAGGGGWEKEVLAAAIGILERRFAEWLENGRYARIYETYRREYPVIGRSTDGRLLVMVGRALEAMGLYRQASVVYYRALGLDLAPAERDDLYLRRARVYLAAGDLDAAARLLAYLRRLYRKGEMAAAVRGLSARFLLRKGKRDEALGMFAAAFAVRDAGGALGALVDEAAPLLLSSGRLDLMEEQLERCRKNSCLPAARLQKHYLALGEALRDRGLAARGDRALRAVLAVGPRDAKPARKAAFLLGTSGDGKLLETLSGDDLWAGLARIELESRRIRDMGP